MLLGLFLTGEMPLQRFGEEKTVREELLQKEANLDRKGRNEHN